MPFEQYERHTVWDKPGGLANRSGVGDLDVIVYSARKWARLALAGNPTVLLVLFVPDQEVVFRNRVGAELVENADRFVSRLVADRFLGYLQSQKAAMTGEVGAHTNRPELVAAHGYDTKFAMHALRLGLQGVELLTTGRITLPVTEPDLSYLRSIRRAAKPATNRLRPPVSEEGSEYLYSEGIPGAKHFGVWPLNEAAETCFGQSRWPDTHPVPQATVEFEVEDVKSAASELEEGGYRLVHPVRTEPWGQVIARFQAADGMLLGVCFTPSM